MNTDDYKAAAEGRLGANRMSLGLSIIPDKNRGDMDEVVRLRNAIQEAIDYANGRESEWGDRAETAFGILYRALSNAIAQTPPTAVDLPRLVRQSYFGTVRLTIGCMDRMCQVTYYNDKREKQDIRGTSQEVADHINSLPNTPANNNQNETE